MATARLAQQVGRLRDAIDASGDGIEPDQPSPGSYRLTTRAGTPAATHRSGTVPRTTEPAAITTLRPMHAPGSTIAPAPSQLPEPMRTASLRGSCRPIGTSGSAYPWFWSVM